MPRRARIDAVGALHHIICRGIERRKIFRDDDDREEFIRRLGRVLKSKWDIHPRPLVPSILRELDSWIKRRLRCYLWKQWGRSGYRELIKRGVSRDLAWNTAKSAHGPWWLSRSPGLAFALPAKYFAELGLPRLHVKPA